MKFIDKLEPHKSTKESQLSIIELGKEENHRILENFKLVAIDIHKDWDLILKTIFSHKHIQLAMEKAYQNFQEGHKLKDFKYRNGVEGGWYFSDIYKGRFPCILATTDWLYKYEEEEWIEQASKKEIMFFEKLINAQDAIQAIDGYDDIKGKLIDCKNILFTKYPPRGTKPESWRPDNSAHCASDWLKILAETHYSSLSNDWRIIASKNHCIVAGISKETAYLLDLILLTTKPEKIIQNF